MRILTHQRYERENLCYAQVSLDSEKGKQERFAAIKSNAVKAARQYATHVLNGGISRSELTQQSVEQVMRQYGVPKVLCGVAAELVFLHLKKEAI